MSPWAWNHHRRRKALAGTLIHPRAFAAAGGWHATSDAEANDIGALGFLQPRCVVPNGVRIPSSPERAAAQAFWTPRLQLSPGKRVALFYSRFHRKKRVLELIDLWLKLAPTDWVLLMVGIPDEYSVDQLQTLVGQRGANRKVLIVDGTDVPPPYAIADLMVLGTHSENFGLVVAESLAWGVPCLVTNRTPWEGLDAQGAGWCRDWKDFPEELGRLLREPSTTLRNQGAAGPDWMRREFNWDESGRRLIEFYQQLRRSF